jgi:diaminopropionate ammonia-lyase
VTEFDLVLLIITLDEWHKHSFLGDMNILINTPRRPMTGLDDVPYPSTDQDAVAALIKRCPYAAETPLVELDNLAKRAGVKGLWIKDERGRMGLGSFKALGAAYVIAHDASKGSVTDKTYVTASAGNHGMSVAAGAAAFGAKAVVYIAETVPESFADRLRGIGAEVLREGGIYEESMAAALKAAQDNGWDLLSDSSWPGYFERPHRLMEGYLMLMGEAIAQAPSVPTHIMLQAGVGGLAGACAALARKAWGEVPKIVVVEPEFAPAIIESIKAGKAVVSEGPVSDMGRLDCKEPSLIALKGLAQDADAFVTISEAEGAAGAQAAADHGMASSASGAAGIAAVLAAGASDLGLDDQSNVLCILSEEPA